MWYKVRIYTKVENANEIILETDAIQEELEIVDLKILSSFAPILGQKQIFIYFFKQNFFVGGWPE